MPQALDAPKTMLAALAHLKAEFIRERGRGERDYYVSAATVRERGEARFIYLVQGFPGAILLAFVAVSKRVTSAGTLENADGRQNSRHSDFEKFPIVSSTSE